MHISTTCRTTLFLLGLGGVAGGSLAQGNSDDARAISYARSAGQLPANELEYGRALMKVYEAGFTAGRASSPLPVFPGGGGHSTNLPWEVSSGPAVAGGSTHMEVREVDGKLVAIGSGKAEPWFLSAEQLGVLLKDGALSKKYDASSGKPYWSGPGALRPK